MVASKAIVFAPGKPLPPPRHARDCFARGPPAESSLQSERINLAVT